MPHPIQAALFAIVFFLFVITLALQAKAIDTLDQTWQRGQALRYHQCISMTHSNPQDAFDEAISWEGLGGGDPARHCQLVALMALGHYQDAAVRLEKLALTIKAEKPFKVRILNQSANAWIAANKPDQARKVATTALNLAPGDIEALMARAFALGVMQALDLSVQDLNQVLEATPNHVEALVLRGSAYRQLNNNDLALKDLNKALAINPTHPEGLLERGIVHRLNNKRPAARKDWRLLIQTHPKSEAARRAKIDLHNLNSGLKKKPQ